MSESEKLTEDPVEVTAEENGSVVLTDDKSDTKKEKISINNKGGESEEISIKNESVVLSEDKEEEQSATAISDTSKEKDKEIGGGEEEEQEEEQEFEDEYAYIPPNVEENPFSELPTEVDFANAKAYLLTEDSTTGKNLYDHLARCIKYVLDNQPVNAFSNFEDISSEMKRTEISADVNTFFKKNEPQTDVELATIQKRLYHRGNGDEPDENEEEAAFDEADIPAVPNLMQTVFFFEQAGVGLHREEMFRLWLSLKKLAGTLDADKVRFWGKIIGRKRNYYVAQVELAADEGSIDEEEEEEGGEEEDKEEEAKANEEVAEETEGAEEEEDNLPKIKWKPPIPLPVEERGEGANRLIFYVCNEPGKKWVRLPGVTPAQMLAARKIRKFFTGRLNEPVVSYPPFPGRERNLLRAQIARITAATLISPLGFYELDEEEDEDELPQNIIEAEEFEELTVEELVDESLANWVHHSMYILPQGRCIYIKPPKVTDDEEEEQEEEEEEGEEPEEGPPLLSPLEEDEVDSGLPLWRVRRTSTLLPRYAVAIVDSLLWPGAHAFAFKTTFENVYIGYGQKSIVGNFNPEVPVRPLDEYPDMDEGLIEAKDPSIEEENALKELKLAKLKATEEEEEGEEEEGDEQEDED